MLRTVQTRFISCLYLEAQRKGMVITMNNRELLPKEGNWYKANLHCHTVISDGTWTKEQVKEEYRKKGYSIVAFTDHRCYGWHPELQDENFLPIAVSKRIWMSLTESPAIGTVAKPITSTFMIRTPRIIPTLWLLNLRNGMGICIP